MVIHSHKGLFSSNMIYFGHENSSGTEWKQLLTTRSVFFNPLPPYFCRLSDPEPPWRWLGDLIFGTCQPGSFDHNHIESKENTAKKQCGMVASATFLFCNVCINSVDTPFCSRCL